MDYNEELISAAKSDNNTSRVEELLNSGNCDVNYKDKEVRNYKLKNLFQIRYKKFRFQFSSQKY